MKDLFNTESQGFGFHVTSHMIALAALFVACFAITGYISFRNESIEKKILDFTPLTINDELGNATVESLNYAGLTKKVYFEEVTIPAETASAVGNAETSFAKLKLEKIPEGSIIGLAVLRMKDVAAGTDVESYRLNIGPLNEATVAGTFSVEASTQLTDAIAPNGATIALRTSAVNNNHSVLSTHTNFYITQSADDQRATTAEHVLECYITVIYPQGVTPI